METQRSAFEIIIAATLKSNLKRYLELYEEIEKYNSGKFPSKKVQIEGYYKQFEFSLDESRLNIFLTAASLIEATANLYLSSKMDAALFAVFDKANFVDKWCHAPKLFSEGYSIPRDGQLYEELTQLKQIRDAIVHSKPEILVNGKRVHKGKVPNKFFQDHSFCLKIALLPYKLLENLLKFDKEFSGEAYPLLRYKPELE